MLYGIKDCANLLLIDSATDKPFLFSDYANVATNEWSSDRVFATAKGTNAISWDSARQGTLAVEMETFDLSWLAMLAGTSMKKGEVKISKREVATVTEAKTITLPKAPLDGSVAVVKLNKDKITHDGEAIADVEVTGSEVTLPETAVVGDFYAVYYLTSEAQGRTFEIKADQFPKSFKIFADVLIREKETGSDTFCQMEFPLARPQSNFSITMSATDPTNLSVTFDLLPNAEKQMAIYNVIG